jgi:pimeloyl-ACP methyl ester carboxylesterase
MLAHTTRGDGERVVIMLHGFLGSGRNLGSLARRLSDRDRSLRIVLPDLRGHGSSPPLPSGADLGTLARDVLDLADRLTPSGPMDLLGHSLGGRVALELRMLAPARAREIALLDIAPGARASDQSELREVLDALLAAPDSGRSRRELDAALEDAGLSRRMVDWLMTNVVRDPAGGSWVWRFDRRALAELQSRISGEDLWPAIGVRDPRAITVIRGGRSPFVSEEDAARLASLGATVETIEDAGHFVHVDQPDRTFAVVARWLDRVQSK